MPDITDLSARKEVRIDAQTLEVTRRSIFSHELRTKRLNITEEQEREWRSGGLIDHTLPHLEPIEREFLLTGATQEEWDEAFPDDTFEEFTGAWQ